MNIAKRPNGKYRARYRDDAGREHARHFDRKIDAQRWLDEVTAAVVTGAYVDPRAGRTTFGTYAGEWLALQPLRPSTISRYDQALRLHILPRLGDRPLSAVRPSEIQALVAELGELSPATVRFAVTIASSIFKAAVRDRRVASNPVTGTKLPEALEHRLEIPTTEQVLALHEAAPPQWRAAVTLGAAAGLRQGETLGVTRDRVDFLRRTLRIDRQLLNRPGVAPYLAPPKTKASIRTIPMPAVLVSGLAAHLAEFPTDDLLFPLSSRQTFGRMWRHVVARVGVPGFGYHGLRHYYASLLIRHGESVKTVQARLGHASAGETLDTYSHLWPDADDQTRAAIDEVLGSADQLRTDEHGAG